MPKWAGLLAVAIVAGTANPVHALDLTPFVGTVQVEFQPMQSAGIKEGCALVYRVVGRDYAYGKGKLITLDGNIAYIASLRGKNVGLSLKIGISDPSDTNGKITPPFFAYLQTPNGTTAGSKVVQFDSDGGFRIFSYQMDGDILKVHQNIVAGTVITIGFNQKKAGLDVLVPLDIRVAESTMAADGSITRHRSNEMLIQFQNCVIEVTDQLKDHLGE